MIDLEERFDTSEEMTVDTNGAIILNRSSIEPIVAENWHSIACDFVVN